MDDYKIVAVTDLAKYQRSARVGNAMAIVALVVVMASCFVVGRMVGKIETYEEAQYVIEKTQRDYNETTQTFVIAWENQQESIRLIEAWAQYIRGRQESIALNRGMGPVARPNWPKRKGVDPWGK